MKRKDPSTRSFRKADPSDASRGQLLLAAGVLVAGLLIVMVAVLNAGIFTSTAATLDRGDDTGDASAFVNTAVEDVDRVYDGSTGPEFEENLTALEQEYQEIYTAENADVSISVREDSLERGWTLVQQDVDGFTDDGLSEGQGQGQGLGHAVIRHGGVPSFFAVEFAPDSLADAGEDHFEIELCLQGPDEGGNNGNPGNGGNGGGSGCGNAHTISFYEQGGNAVVDVEGSNQVAVDADRDENVTVNFQNGYVDGEERLDWTVEDIDHDRVSTSFRNEDEIAGSWAIITRGPDGETEPQGSFDTVDADPDENLEVFEGYEPVDVAIRYRTPETELERTVELGPLSELFG